MIKAYINYPNPRVTIHHNPNCPGARVQANQKQRHVLLNADTLSKELNRFGNNKHKFAAEAGLNDVWLVLDFQDAEFEKAVVAFVTRLVGKHYPALSRGELESHC